METGLVWLVLSWFRLLGNLLVLDCSGDQEFDWEIGSSIDRGFSGILTCWEIYWEINLEDRS